MHQPAKLDIYQRVTDQIAAAIEAGAGTYAMPWNPRLCGGASVRIPHNAAAEYGYHGVNVLSLWGSQQANGYPTAEWASYRQWASIGAQVRGGEKGTMTVFFKALDKDGDANDSDDQDQGTPSRSRFVARAAWVFNAAQVDGYERRPVPSLPEIERHAAADCLKVLRNDKRAIFTAASKACQAASYLTHLPAERRAA